MIVFSSLLRKKQSFGSSDLKSVVYVFVKKEKNFVFLHF